MRLIGVGGAPTNEEVLDWANERDVPYSDMVGSTEIVGAIGLRHAQDAEMRSYGHQVISGLEGLIEKENASDNFGELIVRGQVINTLISAPYTA